MIRGRPAPTASSTVAETKATAKAKTPEFPSAPTEEPVATKAAAETTELPTAPEEEPLIAA